jgi:hypothetical protein
MTDGIDDMDKAIAEQIADAIIPLRRSVYPGRSRRGLGVPKRSTVSRRGRRAQLPRRSPAASPAQYPANRGTHSVYGVTAREHRAIRAD